MARARFTRENEAPLVTRELLRTLDYRIPVGVRGGKPESAKVPDIGTVEVVDQLPEPVKGRIVYVNADYRAPGLWLAADFDLSLTPGHVRSGGAGGLGTLLSGYSNIDSQVYGQFVDPGGELDPEVPGLSAVFVRNQDGRLYLKMVRPLLTDVGRVNLTVTYDGDDYVLVPALNSGDEWVSQAGDLVPLAERWVIGTPVTIRVFVSGTQKGLTEAGLSTIGDNTKPGAGDTVLEGFYHVDPVSCEWVRGLGAFRPVDELPFPARAGDTVYVKADHIPNEPWLLEDFDLTLRPTLLAQPGLDSVTGFSAIPGQIVDGLDLIEGGALSPAPAGLDALILEQIGGGVDQGNVVVALSGELREAVGLRHLIVTFGGNAYEISDSTENGVFTSAVGDGPVAAADYWATGEDTTVRIFVKDTQVGFTSAGLRRVGERTKPAVGPAVKEDFYHVDPGTLTWVRGLGGGGLPAAIIPQVGLTDAQKRDENWRGVLVGLGRGGAGADWKLATVAGQEAVQAHTTIASGGTSLRINLDAGLAGAAGDDGNAWEVDVNPANLSTDPSRARISRANVNNPAVLIVIQQSGRTFAQVAALVNAVAGLTAAVTGPGGAAFPNNIQRQRFAGGLDADELGAEVDDVTKTITVEHLVGHTQADLVAALHDLQVDSDTTLYAVLIAGSNGAAAITAPPKSWPFTRAFPRGSLPRPTSDEIDQRLTAMTTRADGEDVVFELGGREVFRIGSNTVKTLLGNLGVPYV